MTLPISTPNWADSSETGAPVVNNVAGSQLAAIIAVACTGFNVRSVLQVAVVDEVATAMCLGHGYSAAYGKLVKVSGVSVPALNGNKRLTGVSTDAFTYPAPGVADGVYDTGTMEARRAPLGWGVKHINGGGTVVVLRRADAESTEMELRIVDTAASPASATSARWFGVESSTDEDTYAGQFPTQAQLANGQYAWKGSNSATAKRWALIGDSRFLYLFVASASAPADTVNMSYFGDLVSHKSVDPYCCIVGGNVADGGAAANALAQGAINTAPSNYGRAIARSSSLTGGSVRFDQIFLQWSGALGVGGPTYPSPVNGSFQFVRPVFVTEENATYGHPVRGEMPGLAYPLVKEPALCFDLVTPATGDGRTYFYARAGNSTGNSLHIMIDLTGPWR